MKAAPTRNRANSSPARVTSDPSVVNIRIAEFVVNDLKRTTRTLRASAIRPSISTRNRTPSVNGEVRHVRFDAGARTELPDTAPVVRKRSSKLRMVPKVQPLGIDCKTLLEAIERAIGTFLKKDKRAEAVEPQVLESFHDIVGRCLAGHQDFSPREYGIFVTAWHCLSDYLMPGEESMLDKLEQASFVQ